MSTAALITAGVLKAAPHIRDLITRLKRDDETPAGRGARLETLIGVALPLVRGYVEAQQPGRQPVELERDIRAALEPAVEQLEDECEYGAAITLCKDCVYWDSGVYEDLGQGLCRRDNPTVGTHGVTAVWPTTAENDGCGEGEVT